MNEYTAMGKCKDFKCRKSFCYGENCSKDKQGCLDYGQCFICVYEPTCKGKKPI